MLRSLYIATLLSLIGLAAGAQPGNLVQEALHAYQSEKYEKARVKIDSAMMNEEVREDPQGLQLKGFIYKELFNEREEPERSRHRKESMEAFQEALEHGAEGRVKENSTKSLEYLAGTYFDEALTLLDTNRIDKPRELFDQYLSISRELGTNEKELKNNRIAFINKVGTAYMERYEGKSGHDPKSFERTVEAFRKTLDLDPDNYVANYNIGIMYYNRGVQISNELDPEKNEVEIDLVRKKQEESADKFEKALPYMKEAHEQRPKRLETLEGLAGIYYGLNEDKKSEHYKKLKEEVKEKNNR